MLSALALALVLGNSGGAVVFVAPPPRGSDAAGNGSAAAPFATLPRAQSAVRVLLRSSADVDIEVSIAPGAYYNASLELGALDSPPPGAGRRARVTWRGATAAEGAVAGDMPTLYGGARIRNWTVASVPPFGSVWSAPLPAALVDARGRAAFRSLVEGERSTWQARQPNDGGGFVGLNASGGGAAEGRVAWLRGALPLAFDCENASCAVNVRAATASAGSNIRRVTGVDLAARSLAFEPDGDAAAVTPPLLSSTSPSSSPSPSPGPAPLLLPLPRLFLQGAPELIDTPGEWAVRGGRLFYWPLAVLGAAGMDAVVVTAPAATSVVRIVGSDGARNAAAMARRITLSGLRIVGSDMPPTYFFGCGDGHAGNNTLAAADAGCRYAPPLPLLPPAAAAGSCPTGATPKAMAQGMVFVENATDITVEGCALKAAGVAAVWLEQAVERARVVRNWIQFAGGFGVYANGVAPGDRRFGDAAASDCNRGHTIADNLIADGGRQLDLGSGVRLFQSGNNTVAHNRIARFARDGVGAYGPAGCALDFAADWRTRPGGHARTYWGRALTVNGGNASSYLVSAAELLHCRGNVVAFNDISNTQRRAAFGGGAPLTSCGVGANNSWAHNALHDNEGVGGAAGDAAATGAPLSLFLAGGWSGGLRVFANVAFENRNANAFALATPNLTVTDNCLADMAVGTVFGMGTPWPGAQPAYNMSVARNIVWNVTQPGRARCNASTPANASGSCASYYESCALADAFGRDLGFATATLRDEMACGTAAPPLPSPPCELRAAGNQSRLGFAPAQLDAPLVALADRNFYGNAARMAGLVGSCRAWDRHATVLRARPFVSSRGSGGGSGGGGGGAGAAAPEYARTPADYAIPPSSAVVREGGFRGAFNTSEVGTTAAFPFGGGGSSAAAAAAYNARGCLDTVQAERYDRARGLWTTEALALGSSAQQGCVYDRVLARRAIRAGSWARYDGVDFAALAGRRVAVSIRARPINASLSGAAAAVPPRRPIAGASVLFLLESPSVEVGCRILASAVLDPPDRYNQFRVIAGNPGPPGGGGSTVAPPGLATVFMVFVPAPGANPSSTDIGGVVDWFRFAAG
jgi:hypothetical protein